VRAEVVERWGPRLVEALNAVSARLTTDALRQMNAEANDAPVDVVARHWLNAQGLT